MTERILLEPSIDEGLIPETRARARLHRQMLRDRTAVLGLIIVLFFTLAALFGPLLEPHDPNQADVLQSFASPSKAFPLGTDNLGRDELARLLYGARVSIGATTLAALAITVIGMTAGMVSGYFGGWIDVVVSWIVNIVLAFPAFLLALAVTGVLGPGLRNVMISVIAAWWAGYARIIRGSVLVERGKQHIDAARALGTGDWAMLRRHLFPNVVGPIIVLTTLDLGAILLGISGLSFLGLGVAPPTAEWGTMLAESRAYLSEDSNLMLFPGLTIFLLVLGFNLLGDGLRDILDPRLGGNSRR